MKCFQMRTAIAFGQSRGQGIDNRAFFIVGD
jgi:hypothetical protein